MATRILFLAAHLQPFLASGIHSLLKNYDVEIVLYCEKREENQWINIGPNKHLRIFTYDYEPDTFFWKEIDLFKPDIVFCAGWMFRMYLSWSKALKKSGAKTICAMDTQWKGSLKQKVWVLASPFTLRKSFTHAWIPGKRQEDYANRLGFANDELLHSLYAPDTSLFSRAYDGFMKSDQQVFPKKFLYVGRLEPHKLKNLLLVFHSLSQSELGLWRLQIVGDGSMSKDLLLNHTAITVSKSIPQIELQKLAAQGAVFCLCSAEEPWGTVVQEFAAAGMPLLLSKQCGSSEAFLIDNGFICDGADVESIKNALLKMINSSDKELFAMSKNSHHLGVSTNSDTWASELMRLA